ncbi:MAG TPA: hypothetical protein VMI30_05350 [Stellaceae bacterium]|nr:hypothetical protein [Stellaceae bacterium]
MGKLITRVAVAVSVAAVIATLAGAVTGAERRHQSEQYAAPGWVLAGAALDFNFKSGQFWQKGVGLGAASAVLSITRASAETSLLPTSPSGASYLTFASNVPPIVPDLGLQLYEGRTNYRKRCPRTTALAA